MSSLVAVPAWTQSDESDLAAQSQNPVGNLVSLPFLNSTSFGIGPDDAISNVMSEIKPRTAVAYHVFNDFGTEPGVREAIRQTYDGPLAISVDYMVFNVTNDDIRVRMAVHDEDIWFLPSITEKLPADPNDKVGFSDFIESGRVVYSEVLEQVYSDANELYGTNYEAPK